VGGAVAGGIIGGILGHQVGGGRGRDVATVRRTRQRRYLRARRASLRNRCKRPAGILGRDLQLPRCGTPGENERPSGADHRGESEWRTATVGLSWQDWKSGLSGPLFVRSSHAARRSVSGWQVWPSFAHRDSSRGLPRSREPR
jgi:hypothetical protein